MQEARGAKAYSGSVNSGSGNGWIRKADVRTETELYEFKTTTKESFSLKASDLMKLRDQALIDDKLPVFEIEFAERGHTAVILTKEDWLHIRKVLEEIRILDMTDEWHDAPEGSNISKMTLDEYLSSRGLKLKEGE